MFVSKLKDGITNNSLFVGYMSIVIQTSKQRFYAADIARGFAVIYLCGAML